jgi:ubiquinone/menaquinone biosynthesis C-methylase UbiE
MNQEAPAKATGSRHNVLGRPETTIWLSRNEENSMESSYEAESIQHWNALHEKPRFRPRYPNEPVVRFLMTSFPEERRPALKALDIGVGGGRHVKVLCELGFQTFGIDISDEGLRQTEDWLRSLGWHPALQQASMSQLPFADNTFDVAVSCGVYYYADADGVRRAISELHRVLAPEAMAFVMMRTTSDYRYGKGMLVERNTYRLAIDETNERGSVMHFLDESDIADKFAFFSQVRYDKTETTTEQRARIDSDWLITVRK